MASEKSETSTAKTKMDNRISKDQMRAFENLHTVMARTLASKFSSIQRSVIDFDIAYVDQTTYGEFVASLTDPCCGYTVTLNPPDKLAAIVYSVPVAYSFIDRHFGGDGRNPLQDSHPFTALERDVMNGVIEQTLTGLTAALAPVQDLEAKDLRFESTPQFLGVCNASETVILVVFEYNAQHASGIVSLCYPYGLLEPFLDKLDEERIYSHVTQDVESGDDDAPLLDVEIPAPSVISAEDTLEHIAAKHPQDMAGLFQSLLLEEEKTPSGAEKITTLIAGLGPELAKPVLRYFRPGEREKILAGGRKLKHITVRQKNDVFNEAKKRLIAGDYILFKGINRAREILRDSEDSFEPLRNADARTLTSFISKEHPQAIALIISQLPAKLAASVLGELSDDVQADVAFRIAVLDNISMKSLQKLEKCLMAELKPILAGMVKEVGGPKAVAEILNASGRTTEKEVLVKLDERDPELAEEVRNQMFVFDDIANLTDREIQAILREVDTKDLAVALKGGSEKLQERIFRNVSDRVEGLIKLEIQYSGPVRMSDVEQVQLRIVQTVRQLEEAGQIKVVRGDSSDVFV